MTKRKDWLMGRKDKGLLRNVLADDDGVRDLAHSVLDELLFPENTGATGPSGTELQIKIALDPDEREKVVLRNGVLVFGAPAIRMSSERFLELVLLEVRGVLRSSGFLTQHAALR